MTYNRALGLVNLLVIVAVCRGWKFSIDTSCKFECEAGEAPVRRPGFDPSTEETRNCGLGYDKADHSHVIGIPQHVKSCCKERHLCFTKCDTPFKDCEQTFIDCAGETCKEDECMVELSDTGLMESSCASFKAIRRRACGCGDRGEAPGHGEASPPEEDSGEEDSPMKGPEEVDPSMQITRLPAPGVAKQKYKVVERGTETHKKIYIMPEDEDEEEYIRKNPLPDGPPIGAHSVKPTRARKNFAQELGDDLTVDDIIDDDFLSSTDDNNDEEEEDLSDHDEL